MFDWDYIVTFVDFMKVYCFIDRESLFNILKDVGVDSNTKTILNEAEQAIKVTFMV